MFQFLLEHPKDKSLKAKIPEKDFPLIEGILVSMMNRKISKGKAQEDVLKTLRENCVVLDWQPVTPRRMLGDVLNDACCVSRSSGPALRFETQDKDRTRVGVLEHPSPLKDGLFIKQVEDYLIKELSNTDNYIVVLPADHFA